MNSPVNGTAAHRPAAHRPAAHRPAAYRPAAEPESLAELRRDCARMSRDWLPVPAPHRATAAHRPPGTAAARAARWPARPVGLVARMTDYGTD